MPLEGMDSSLYSEDAPATDTEKAPDGKPESVDEQEAMDPTSLVDVKVLTGKNGAPKEGDEIMVKVVKIHGDQAEIEYAPEKAEKGEPDSDDDMETLNKTY
jgi:exosome complex RNA-binding protein Csl4